MNTKVLSCEDTLNVKIIKDNLKLLGKFGISTEGFINDEHSLAADLVLLATNLLKKSLQKEELRSRLVCH
jgi:hypothetical protein